MRMNSLQAINESISLLVKSELWRMQQEILTKVNLPVREPARLMSWSVKAGVVIRKGELLCKYQLADGGKIMSLKAQQAGKVMELLAHAGSVIQPG